METINKELAKKSNAEVEADWAHFTNITDENASKRNKISAEKAEFLKEVARDILKLNWRSFSSADIKRQFKKLSKTGYSVLPTEDYAELKKVLSSMQSNFAKVRVCDYKNKDKCDLPLGWEIVTVMITSRDPKELEHYWTQFYNNAGSLSRSSLERYIELSTEEAKLNSK